MKRFLSAILWISALASVAGAQPKSLTILHTNDMHASFVPHEAVWVRQSPKPMIGGFKELAFTVDSIRRSNPGTLLIDAGDVMTGNPITEREYRGAMGGALFEMMNMIGYQVWCPGNHDFDVSQDNLRKLTHLASFPTVCANVVDDNGRYPVGNVPYVILPVAGLRVGIIGIMSQGLYGLVNQNNLAGIRVLSPAETAQRFVDSLTPRTDLLIALTHQGVTDDSLLALNVRGLNVIVGGHSHTRLRKPLVVNGVPIVQTGSNCENLGQLDLVVDQHRVVSFNGKLIPLWVRNNRPQNGLTRLVDSLSQAIEKDYSEVIGTLKGDWIRKEGESAIASFLANAQREAAHADVGFMNLHGIRKDLLAGPITKKDLFEILPFRNILVTFSLTGAQLKSVLEYTIAHRPAIQIAGLRCRWKQGTDGRPEVRDIEVNGTPLDVRREYSCAASDYMAGEAPHYLGLEIPKVIYLSQTVFAAFESAVRRQKTIVPETVYSIQREQ